MSFQQLQNDLILEKIVSRYHHPFYILVCLTFIFVPFVQSLEKTPKHEATFITVDFRQAVICKIRWNLAPLFSSRALRSIPALFTIDFTLL